MGFSQIRSPSTAGAGAAGRIAGFQCQQQMLGYHRTTICTRVLEELQDPGFKPVSAKPHGQPPCRTHSDTGASTRRKVKAGRYMLQLERGRACDAMTIDVLCRGG